MTQRKGTKKKLNDSDFLKEMVIKGVATRKVKKITESLCGLTFSKSQVSQIVKKLDKEIQAWLHRPLDDEYTYVFVDARYNKIRRDYRVESQPIHNIEKTIREQTFVPEYKSYI